MAEISAIATLRQLLVGQYDDLKRQLARRLGSEEMAGDVLQETYLHLERPRHIGSISSPRKYLLTIATNIARMGFRHDSRCTSIEELDAVLNFVDDAPSPLQTVESQQEFENLRRAFAELTPRQRAIVFAARVEEKLLRDIAKELGLSQRTVEKELRAALVFCGAKLNRNVVQRFGPRPREASIGRELAQGEENQATDA
jgi:RNA polymerase sigma-70 factor (ECF subfamily)